jgi:hypothetical protein
MPLDAATLERLSAVKTKTVAAKQGYPAPPQTGPLRFSDREAICTTRRCGSPTYLKVQGAPKCMMHALIELNEMLVNAGFQGVVTNGSN